MLSSQRRYMARLGVRLVEVKPRIYNQQAEILVRLPEEDGPKPGTRAGITGTILLGCARNDEIRSNRTVLHAADGTFVWKEECRGYT